MIFGDQAAKLLNKTEQAKVMEYVTSWEEKGIEIGRREGRKEEARQLILRLLRRRFGPLPAEVESQIGQLPIDGLEDLDEASLDFAGLAELRNWLTGPAPISAHLCTTIVQIVRRLR